MLVSATASYFDANIVNAGPLTSTFTPPATCTRAPHYGVKLLGPNGRDGSWQTECDDRKYTRKSLCLPSESAWVNEPKADYSKDANDITYYSPGLACPSGFTTVGAAVVGQGMNNVTQSGQMFSASTTQTYDDFQLLPIASYLCDNMAASETAVFCCPSGYTGNYLGACSSTVTSKKAEELGITSVCRAYVSVVSEGANVTSLHGRTYSPPLVLPDVLGTTESVQELPIPLPTSTGTQYITASAVVDYVEMIILVHKEEELKSIKTSDGKNSAPAARPSLYNVAAAMPFALAIGAVLSGVFVL